MENIINVRKKYNESPTINNATGLINHPSVTWNDLLLCLKSKNLEISDSSKSKLENYLNLRRGQRDQMEDIDCWRKLIEKRSVPFDFRAACNFEHIKAERLNGNWLIKADVGLRVNSGYLFDMIKIIIPFWILAAIGAYNNPEISGKIIYYTSLLSGALIFITSLMPLLLYGRTKKIHAYKYILSNNYLEIENSDTLEAKINWESIESIEWKGGFRVKNKDGEAYTNKYLTKGIYKFIVNFYQMDKKSGEL